ncbi:tail fiber domain-containing protein [Streptomyces smyrnaeus]|uniref:Tail fiber domain-containing protein n=1 Tax=Streptomyces smyrnaeus TaxID=1387713 RepID=A0ABS3XN23_9ACTN|nr:tail fiber domain-containing protein [Streptomyces smyrnaeus]MBO8196726.1 tail fiber domain-containing protein [Streptomyces smyrnaeus]
MNGWFLRGVLARMRTPAPVKEARRRGTSLAGPASGATAEAVRAGAPVNGHDVLEQVARLPVSTWRYHWDPPHVRHIGPMAQDWWAAFEVGENDRTICCTDANGVALVAIQALHRQLEELRSEVAALRAQVAHQQPQESEHAGPRAG